MGPAGLDRVGELLALGVERVGQRFQHGLEISPGEQHREMHRGRKRVVRRLRHVDVVVGMDPGVVRARLAQDLERAVGHDFVHVHVERDSGTRLEDVDDELVAELPGEHVLARLDDRASALLVQDPELQMSERGGLLDVHVRIDQPSRLAQAADREVLERARGLDAVVGVGGNLLLTEQVFFRPRLLRVYYGGSNDTDERERDQ